ncbi:unnamed protein product [Mycetohabitans rhizoxinica HKI 454]|uniref:Uncharacterized protein n=1 Tax=Mycetohabitans rhizoxinica (strain DSM 19002 / CIP 109453 / HKI 454) TaxID=882378 RepID=E5ANK7_MYCRK|nr:unnamed protein product [Mycetohabitans rhizoxinica HKI 454]
MRHCTGGRVVVAGMPGIKPVSMPLVHSGEARRR